MYAVITAFWSLRMWSVLIRQLELQATDPDSRSSLRKIRVYEAWSAMSCNRNISCCRNVFTLKLCVWMTQASILINVSAESSCKISLYFLCWVHACSHEHIRLSHQPRLLHRKLFSSYETHKPFLPGKQHQRLLMLFCDEDFYYNRYPIYCY